jgi:zinc transporter ZupT
VTKGASARIVDAWRPWSGTWKHAIGWAALTAVAGILVWVGIVAVTGSQSLYMAVALGAAIGFAVHAGSRRDRWRPAALAAVIAVLTAVIGLYYVNRFTFVQNELDAGRELVIPVVPNWAWFTFVIEQGARSEQFQMLYLALAPVIAAFVAFRGTDALADS